MNKIIYRVEVFEGRDLLEHSELFLHRERAEQEKAYFEHLYAKDLEDGSVRVQLTGSMLNEEESK